MKRLFISLILIATGISAYAQSPHRFISLTPAYPVAIGETTTDSLIYSNSGIYIHDIIQDSLPVYEIGHIYTQTVRYSPNGFGFYVKADSLHSAYVTFSFETDTFPRGPIELNETTGRFKFYPLVSDYYSFVIRFIGTNGTDTVWEDVVFNMMPPVVDEEYAFQTEGEMPSSTDYTLIAYTDTVKFLNNFQRDTCYSYSISGKEIVFDNAVQNKVWGLSGREDIYELNIFAERLVIRSALKFPQTDVTIHAREVVFEDHDGIVASINTTPSPIQTYTNETGQNGANAGNITIYANAVATSNTAMRLICIGANGQSTNRNGTPGNGGNGGVVTSNKNIRSLCDIVRGSAGVKFDSDSLNANNMGDIIGSGTIGQHGYFMQDSNRYAWLHPYWVSAVIRHANDAFINNYIEFTLNTCKEYHTLINEYVEAVVEDSCEYIEDAELMNSMSEIDAMLFKLEQGLDYFGNPVGWVPLLSFEVMLANYNAEIDRAIPTLYMYYWINSIDQTLQHWVEASQFAASMTEQSIQDNVNLINTLVFDIPVLEDQIANISAVIDSLKHRLDVLQEQLMAKARHNVKKRNRIKKAVKLGKALVDVFPVFGPVGALASTATNSLFTTGIADAIFDDDGIDYASVYNSINTLDWSAISAQVDNINALIDATGTGIGGGVLNNNGQIKTAYNLMNQTFTPLFNTFGNINKMLSKGSTPKSEVDNEYKRLCAESAEYQFLDSEIKKLDKKKTDFKNKKDQTFNNIQKASTEMGSDVLALDALRRDAFVGNSKRDLNAMQYIEKMEQRAKSRLLKYHYYLRKAYEYRLLKPYEAEFNLVGMFERFEALGMALDSVVDPNAYSSLSSIFRDVVSDIIEEVIDEYSNNYPEQSAPITIVIPREQLESINAGNNMALNFYEMGIFSPDEENVRIVDLSVYHIETHIEGNIGYSGYMDLIMTHEGVSRFRKDGQIYWFDHMSRTSINPHTWGVRYDAVSQENTAIRPSAASASLLSSLINSSGNIMLFSRPSAWGDINITKKVHTSGGANIVIDSLVLRLQYDFTRRPNNIRNIDITTNDELLPYIACSEVDRNGRSNGNGNLNRSYNVSSQPLTFTAIEQYGNWYFSNWTNRAGDTVSATPALTVSRTTDQFYTANYERRVPILEVPDTVFVSYDGGIYTVNVANIGAGNIEMDWYVDDSISTWVHLNGSAEGIDSGMFSFICEANESGIDRIDSLEIFAPETDLMAKTIYIAQVESRGFSVSANVLPEGSGYVTGTGFYAAGDTATLTAIPADSCRFVSWEQDGQEVSTQPVYSFAVNNDILLTANFDCEDLDIHSADGKAICIYPNPATNAVTVEGEGIVSVRLYTLLGVEVACYRPTTSGTFTMNISTLADGLYFLIVETTNGISYQKLVKSGK